MRRQLAAFLLLTLFLFRAGMSWAGLYGPCQHAGGLDSAVLQTIESPCPHHSESQPTSPCHGETVDGAALGDATCACDCCHVTAAFPALGILLAQDIHVGVEATPLQRFLSHIPPPIVRPPITSPFV